MEPAGLYLEPNSSKEDKSEHQSQMLKSKTDDRSHPEYQYLDLISRIFRDGYFIQDRTGTGTLSLFGSQIRFPLIGAHHSFPLLTTKRVFWRGVVEELLWFIRGDTNAAHLTNKGVHIWDANGSREFLDSRHLTHHEVNDLGPIYGFQWRHFGAKYQGMDQDYQGQGVDQLQDCIRKIKETPHDRRIIMSAWNPFQIDQMALPPCHVFCHFHVNDKNELSCIMYQRSCDMGLGIPFNIASYSLLTCMIAQVCNLVPGEFIHMMGDTHIYLNHREPLEEQLKRTPKPFPTLKLNPLIKEIDHFKLEDIELEGYECHPAIKMPFSS